MSAADSLIGRRIAEYRSAISESQASLAAMMSRHGLKWSQATVWSVEQGKRPLRLTEAAIIAHHYFISVEDLLADVAHPEATPRSASEILSIIESETRALRAAITA